MTTYAENVRIFKKKAILPQKQKSLLGTKLLTVVQIKATPKCLLYIGMVIMAFSEYLQI